MIITSSKGILVISYCIYSFIWNHLLDNPIGNKNKKKKVHLARAQIGLYSHNKYMEFTLLLKIPNFHYATSAAERYYYLSTVYQCTL